MRIYRDELGRFARAPARRRQRRDELGRFAAVPLKKVPSRKVPPKKASSREVPPRKLPRKVPPKKAPPRKVLPKKALPRKKAQPRKVPPKKVLPRKKAQPRKVPPKKSLPREVPPKKALPREVPPKKVLPKKAPPKKAPPRKVPPKKARPRRPRRPLVAERSLAAEADMQVRLLALQSSIDSVQSGLDQSVKTYCNPDGTVDGELRIGSLPDEWRTMAGIPYLIATLSNAVRAVQLFDAKPSMGGAFWISFGVRFGPQNEAEVGELANLYKRYRGLFQIGTYPTPAWGQGAVQVALTGDTVGMRAMIESLLRKRGLPPTVLLIRVIWTPDGSRPAHYQGEKGET